jgi:hypothetical protein
MIGRAYHGSALLLSSCLLLLLITFGQYNSNRGGLSPLAVRAVHKHLNKPLRRDTTRIVSHINDQGLSVAKLPYELQSTLFKPRMVEGRMTDVSRCARF